jgi:hypothetical protein
MEAIGVGLGTAAILSCVLDVFRVVTSFRDYSEASTILFHQLDLEREVLLRWATEVGLYPMSDNDDAAPGTTATRSAIPDELLPLVHKIIATIGALLVKATSPRQAKGRPESDVQELRLVLENLQSRRQEQSLHPRLGPSKSFSRLGWAIGEQERLKELVTTIHTYNASLHNLIPKPLQIQLDGSLMQALLSERTENDLSEIQHASFQWRKAISAVASVTALQRARTTATAPAPLSTNQLMLQRSDISSLGRDMTRHLTVYESRGEKINVLIEWRACTLPLKSEKKFQYLNTCLDLARLLHVSQSLAAYRTMDCIGVFDDVEFRPHPRVGLVYRVPSAVCSHAASSSAGSDSIRIYTLHDLINRKEVPRPRLDQRFELARSLATGLHRLFVSRWYHKNLNSKNILFFVRKRSGKNDTEFALEDEHILHPFLCGFDYARPDSPEEMSIKPEADEFCNRYRHPQYVHSEARQEIRYSRRFDIYSLGVLLTELGRWETVDRMQREYTVHRRKGKEMEAAVSTSPSSHGFHRYLRTHSVESLGFRMGKIYTDAVRFCLDGGGREATEPENSEETEETLVDAFNKKVVAELARCTV